MLERTMEDMIIEPRPEDGITMMDVVRHLLKRIKDLEEKQN